MLSGGKELAPRFKRSNIVTAATTNSVDDLQMRPPTNSLLFKASNINKQNPQQLPINQQTNRSGNSSPGITNSSNILSISNIENLIPAFNTGLQISNGSPTVLLNKQEVKNSASHQQNLIQPHSPQNNNLKKEQNVAVTKQGSIEKPRVKKEKGPSRDEALKKVSKFLTEILFNKEVKERIKTVRFLNGFNKLYHEIYIYKIYTQFLIIYLFFLVWLQ